jgi:hypothetical protein
MYESPITITERIVNKAREQMENDITNNILTATAEYGVFVNKDELIKALQYDRNQYNKGYADGYSEFAFDFYKAFREHYKAYIPDGLVRMADVVELLESVKQGGVAE